MKKYVVLISCFFAFACSNQAKEPVSTDVEEVGYSQSELVGMHTRANAVLQKITDSESLATMYHLDGKSSQLSTMSTSMLQLQPTLLPESDLAAPYYVCDTAFSDLAILIGAMGRDAASRTQVTSNIVNQEKLDYSESLAQCKTRLAMSPEQARADADA